MRRLTPLIVLAVAAVSFLALRPAATTDASAVEGVWKTVHVTLTNPEGTQEIDSPAANHTIYTATHYAFVFVVGEEPRETLPEDPTDEQLLNASRRFRASAGTYEVEGNEIHQKVIVHKSPNLTAEQIERSSTFEVDGDTMVVTFTTDAGLTVKVRSTRVE